MTLVEAIAQGKGTDVMLPPEMDGLVLDAYMVGYEAGDFVIVAHGPVVKDFALDTVRGRIAVRTVPDQPEGTARLAQRFVLRDEDNEPIGDLGPQGRTVPL